MNPREAAALREALEGEASRPEDIQKLIERLESACPDSAPLLRFLATKDLRSRQAFHLKSQETWFRTFQWTMGRAIIWTGLIGAGVFLLAGPREQIALLATFFFGASFYYLVLLFLSGRRIRRERAKVQGIEDAYRAEVRALIEELGKSEPPVR